MKNLKTHISIILWFEQWDPPHGTKIRAWLKLSSVSNLQSTAHACSITRHFASGIQTENFILCPPQRTFCPSNVSPIQAEFGGRTPFRVPPPTREQLAGCAAWHCPVPVGRIACYPGRVPPLPPKQGGPAICDNSPACKIFSPNVVLSTARDPVKTTHVFTVEFFVVNWQLRPRISVTKTQAFRF